MKLRYLTGSIVLLAGGSLADPLPAPDLAPAAQDTAMPDSACAPDDLSVLTYNVAGLPWPLAKKGPVALRAIGERLARMRAEGCAPRVVVLQEAFSAEAKAIGARAGYAYSVEGPYLRTGGVPPGMDRSWMLGETAGTPVDSGLVVLSDLPVLDVQRAAFPEGACAGYDCLAAKGVVLVTLQLASGRAVMVATTHFNSRGASKAPVERTLAAYRRQADFLARFIAAHRAPGMPLVIAGDFNRGQRPGRMALLDAAMARLAGGPLLDSLRICMNDDPGAYDRSLDALTIARRARDLQFAIDGEGAGLQPVGIDIPFGTEPDGTMLSDHIGYTVRYRYTAS
ncbi:hypothetical protein GCM10011349_27820 [Novosphingobium indicum]|uniref:Endonuclease/exonuclease/phosphatase domain-containing protein n=1 Tax=Novosphingobium indicum TaxID=462949 RepID=A0ABQ2JRY5_9SPHN|nr:endonuclease/exonuclease/phosphatase family protein [Novosphingobium indicum]GGN53323.1 hypothetical protein GCM10011349_27820 [Novosphingobium indicum]